MAVAFEIDPSKGCSYSLPRSKHEALRHLAREAGHDNKSRILDEILEAYFRSEYGRKWKIALFLDGEDDVIEGAA